MNCLFFATSNFKPDTGGIAELGHQLATALVEAGHTVTVIARKNGSQDSDKSYRILRTDKKQPVMLADRLIREEKPDVLFVLVIGSSWLSARKLGKRYSIPVFIYVHGLEITKKNNIYPIFAAKQWVKGSILKRSDLVICNSFNTMLLAVKRGAVPENVRVLNPGINVLSPEEGSIDIIPPDDPASGKRVFFSLCRLVERKGIDMVIRSLPLLKDEYPDLLYVVAGTGKNSYVEELKELAHACGVSDQVLFLGKISEEQKRSWMTRQEVFIMPSRQLSNGDVEGFGIVFLEAAMYGKPVIGGFSGGIPDAIQSGKTGVLVDPVSVNDIAAKMRFFLENPHEGKKMGALGKIRASERFSWNLQAMKFAHTADKDDTSAPRLDFNDWKDLPKNEIFNKNIARDNLFLLKDCFDEAGLPFLIFFGTLLGALRENDFISHDTDTDVIVFESFRGLFYQVLPELEEKGLKLVRSVKDNRVLSLYRNGEYIDLYFVTLKRIGLRRRWYIDYSSVSKKSLLETKLYNFLGRDFMIPKKSEDVLKELYGKNWRIPIKDYEANHDFLMKLWRFLRKGHKMNAVKRFLRWMSTR